MKTLKLFNAVLSRESEDNIFVSENGFIIESNALWAKDRIIDFYNKEYLSGNDLNKTFHKSWDKVLSSSRYELYLEQINHYLSTYGSNFKSEVYIPFEVLDIEGLSVKFKVIKAYSKEKLITKSLNILKSGIALKEETVDDLISILTDELDYKFTGKEGIINKEAIVKIAENYGIYPDNPVEFLRYIVFRSTNSTLLIKSNDSINMIKSSTYNPSQAFKDFGLERLSTIFNRFKPLFLAYKNKCGKTINKIGKLSKTNHVSLTSNPLTLVTQRVLTQSDLHWLNNATTYSIFKAMISCYNRGIVGQDTFTYRIRNGKSWTDEKLSNKSICIKNLKFLKDFLKTKIDLSKEKVYIPDYISYALPTSEKMFVGNLPTGTKIYGEKLAVGIYWENSWGATDLDLSGINSSGKVGWDSSYNQSDSLIYSGDITDARDGAVEYLYANKGLTDNTLVLNNVYNGDPNTTYKIIVGGGDSVDEDYMMNPEKLIIDIKCESVQKNTILGMLIPEGNSQSFCVLNFGQGQSIVSTKDSSVGRALTQQWKNPLSLKEILTHLGAEFTSKDESTIDLSVDSLEKDTLMDIFKS